MRLISTLTLCFTLAGNVSLLAQNLPYPANATFFTGQPPSLLSADTLETSVGYPYPSYYFSFNVPVKSPESVGSVSIAPQENGDPIVFDFSKTTAFQGTRQKQGTPISIKSTTQDPTTKVITVSFAQPVPPNTTFTVSMRPYSNPQFAGTYIFRVQIYPAGANPIGLDLGVGSFSFYSWGR
ncbi:MAG: hypothetical protein N5P05_001723 [Chroococcopsis gigantea SAG 12.99]|jgi:hypothetical protein|nr:DUF2808 domain-containing protein [Chlorogloea purpurea SAG 13.99]MDV3000117.1 hypothetical protein [Chroococcopsis gigantea SAG 12.99]